MLQLLNNLVSFFLFHLIICSKLILKKKVVGVFFQVFRKVGKVMNCKVCKFNTPFHCFLFNLLLHYFIYLYLWVTHFREWITMCVYNNTSSLFMICFSILFIYFFVYFHSLSLFIFYYFIISFICVYESNTLSRMNEKSIWI